MFRSQARGCYPEKGQPDGCFPDNDTTPSRFKCWDDPPSPADLLSLLSSRDQTSPPRRGRGRRGRGGRGER